MHAQIFISMYMIDGQNKIACIVEYPRIFSDKNQRVVSDRIEVNEFVKSHKRDLLDALA